MDPASNNQNFDVRRIYESMQNHAIQQHDEGQKQIDAMIAQLVAAQATFMQTHSMINKG